MNDEVIGAPFLEGLARKPSEKPIVIPNKIRNLIASNIVESIYHGIIDSDYCI